jgi:hypothetical protein
MPETEVLVAKIEKLKRTIRRWEIFAGLYCATLAGAALLSEANAMYVRHKLEAKCDRYREKAEELRAEALEQRSERDKLEEELRGLIEKERMRLFQAPPAGANKQQF